MWWWRAAARSDGGPFGSPYLRAISARSPQVLGPDVGEIEYVTWQADQDAYAFSGQKCSAQSMLIAHDNWMGAGIVEKLAERAGKRSLTGLTVGPILS